MEAELASKVGSAASKSGPKLKWLKDSSSSSANKTNFDKDRSSGLADEQRAQASSSFSSSSNVGSSTGASVSGLIQVKQPVLKTLKASTIVTPSVTANSRNQPVMIEVLLNDRLGKKVRVKCNSNDTIGDLKKLAAAQLGTKAEKLRIQKWYTIYKDHIRLDDYEIHDGMSMELYYM